MIMMVVIEKRLDFFIYHFSAGSLAWLSQGETNRKVYFLESFGCDSINQGKQRKILFAMAILKYHE